MKQVTGVGGYITKIYEAFAYQHIDAFSHVTRELMSPTSGLATALQNLQSAPNETRDISKGQTTLHYEHFDDSFVLLVTGENIPRFALERIFYNGVSVDLITYLGQEPEEQDHFHRAAIVHNNGHNTEIPRDAFDQPKDPSEYLAKFLQVIHTRREEILKAAKNPDLVQKESEPRKLLEAILDSTNQPA